MNRNWNRRRSDVQTAHGIISYSAHTDGSVIAENNEGDGEDGGGDINYRRRWRW